MNINLKNPNSVSSIIENKNSSYKLMDFETTFLKERGVSYNPEAITDFATKQAYLSLVLAANNRNKQIQNLLYDATTAVDGNNKYGAPFQDATGACINNLKRCLNQAYIELYGEEKINVKSLDSNELVRISKNLQSQLDENCSLLLNGKTIAEYEAECKQAYNLAYGEENGTRLAEAFVESQARGVQAIKAGVQGVGMLVTIAGQVIPVGGQIASAMIWGGMALGTFGGATVQIAEDVTKAGGITEKDKKAIIQELTQSLALVAAGGAVGKVSSLGFAKMVMANCPRTLSYATKYGMDVVLGAVADMAITGDYNITQETVTNLIPVIIGITKTKGSMTRFVQNEMMDAVGTLPRDYFSTHPQEFDRVINIMLDNHTHLGYLSKLDDTYWNEIIKSSQKPPVGEQYVAIMVYKENSSDINNLLSYINTENKIPFALERKKDNLQRLIRNITDYINTTSLDKPITVYRDDTGFKLKEVMLSENINLGDKLDALYNELLDAKKSLNIMRVNEIKNEIKDFEAKLKSENLEFTFTQERFMSTTFVRENRFNAKKSIRFELDIPQNAKGTFIETYNNATQNGKEVEYLLQRDTKVSVCIKNIEWSDEFNCWFIKASISQD